MASKSKKKNTKKKGEKEKLKKAKGVVFNPKKKNKSKKDKTTFKALSTSASIGNFGEKIIFEVNQDTVLTFSDFSRTVSGKWNVHDAIGKKGKTEFLGPELSSNTMTVILDKGHGIDPRKMISKIEKAVNKGTVEYLVVGGKKVGTKKMRITEMSESWDEIYSNGALYRATINLTFEDYVK